MSSIEYVRDPHSFAGRVEMRPFASACLEGNALGDPHVREVPVYLPPGWDVRGARFPVVYLLAAFTSRPHSFLDTHPWRRGIIARYDAAVADERAPAAIIVMPDAFTTYGGSQYVNSSATGAYEDYVAEEIPAWVDEHYPTQEGARAVTGKSSGGFGALHLAMRRPDLFRAAASVSGDCFFEYCFGQEILACLRGLQKWDGNAAQFLEDFARKPDLGGDGHAIVNTLAMAACYSPNADAPLGFDLPFDPHTGARIESVWERWLAFDPFHAAPAHADALRQLGWLYLECGTRDEFHLLWGMRLLARRLRELNVPFHAEEHPGGHRGLDERFDALLPQLIRAAAE